MIDTNVAKSFESQIKKIDKMLDDGYEIVREDKKTSKKNLFG